MGSIRPRAELGVELASQHEGMVGQLSDLDEAVVGRYAAVDQTRLTQNRTIGVIELEARRIVPPMSVMACWSGIRLMTGWGVL
jgi:hypothetical protein